jgi:16S rRNA (guanine(966)-N(2))-methyltransferase RsmD
MGAMRIISGQFGSRQLKGTPPPGLRPTSDKLRETLFNIFGPAIEGAVFFDACAGMGGVGIEAISRGAQFVHFVDSSRKACEIIRKYLSTLGVQSGYRVHTVELRQALQHFQRDNIAFDIAFLDPPYDREDLYTMALEFFGAGSLLKESGILVMEHSKRYDLSPAGGVLSRYRLLNQGDSCLSFYRKDA